DVVVTGIAEHQVVAAVAGERIVGRKSVDRVVAGTADRGEEESHFRSLSVYRRPRRAFGRWQHRLSMVCILPQPRGTHDYLPRGLWQQKNEGAGSGAALRKKASLNKNLACRGATSRHARTAP